MSSVPVFLAPDVTDLERSVAFYRDAMRAVPLEEDDNRTTDRWLGGRHFEFSWRTPSYFHFALFPAPQGEGPTTRAQIGFFVADADEAHEHAVAARVEVIHGPRLEFGSLYTARYRDPDGNVVSLTERRDAPS